MFTKEFLLDVAERSVWTFLQTTLALLFVDGAIGTIDATFITKLKVAAIAGLAAVVKGLVASKFGDSSTAQALPGGATYSNEPQG